MVTCSEGSRFVSLAVKRSSEAGLTRSAGHTKLGAVEYLRERIRVEIGRALRIGIEHQIKKPQEASVTKSTGIRRKGKKTAPNFSPASAEPHQERAG